MRLDYPQYRTQVDTYIGQNPDNPTTHTWTWTRPAGASLIQVTCIGGGGSGGSGRRGAAGTYRAGGDGGMGAGFSTALLPAAFLDDTVEILAGLGGVGGPGITTDDTNGDWGTSGQATSFGAYLVAIGGFFGRPGRSTPYSAESPDVSYTSMVPMGVGGYEGGGGYRAAGCPGGGGGGRIFADDTTEPGGNGGFSTSFNYWQDVPGPGVNGADYPLQSPGPGQAGGGGSTDSSSGIDGGNGGAYGAGGGGGAASVNGTVSGAGGNGGPGICVVVTFF